MLVVKIRVGSWVNKALFGYLVIYHSSFKYHHSSFQSRNSKNSHFCRTHSLTIVQCTQNDYPQIPSLFVCIFLTTPLLFSLFPWVMSWVFIFIFLTPFYLCSLKYLLFFFLFNCKTHPHITMYKICLNLWDPAKLSQPTTEKKEKRKKKPSTQTDGVRKKDCGSNLWRPKSMSLLQIRPWSSPSQVADIRWCL